MASKLDPILQAIVDKFIATSGSKRALVAVKILLKKGEVSTDDLKEAGYRHAPRAIGDLRDAGVPILTTQGTSTDGNRQAVYIFGSAGDIQEGRNNKGRLAINKKFREKLLAHYECREGITGARLDGKVLQIDHRVPYRVGGDGGLAEEDVNSFMLLDASSQRAKSWACEHCDNFLRLRDIKTCLTCFWANPLVYKHIAMQQMRRVDLVFKDEDVGLYDSIKRSADAAGLTVSAYVLNFLKTRERPGHRR